MYNTKVIIIFGSPTLLKVLRTLSRVWWPVDICIVGSRRLRRVYSPLSHLINQMYHIILYIYTGFSTFAARVHLGIWTCGEIWTSLGFRNCSLFVFNPNWWGLVPSGDIQTIIKGGTSIPISIYLNIY